MEFKVILILKIMVYTERIKVIILGYIMKCLIDLTVFNRLRIVDARHVSELFLLNNEYLLLKWIYFLYFSVSYTHVTLSLSGID